MEKCELPSDTNAEKALLGAVLLSMKDFYHVNQILLPDDFFDKGHKLIFEAIIDLWINEKPVDVIMVLDKLREINGSDFDEIILLEMINSTPSASNVIEYACIIQEKAKLRSLIQIANSVMEKCKKYEPIKTILDYADNELKQLDQRYKYKDE